MIIDAHAHACGDFLHGPNIIETLDRNGVDQVVLVPGELGSSRSYSLPDLAALFPARDVVAITNVMTKAVIGLSGKAGEIDAGNAYVHGLARGFPDRIIQFYWARLSASRVLERLERDFQRYAFKGIKVHQCWESFDVGSDTFERVAEWATMRGLPISVSYTHLRAHET